MEVKKTLIFMRYNPYTGMGGESFMTTTVYQCIASTGSMSSSSTYVYFKLIGTVVRRITEKELHKLQNENHEALKHLDNEDA